MGAWDYRILSYVKIGGMGNLTKPWGVSREASRSTYCNTVSEIWDFMLNTIEGFPMKKISNYDITPCDVIFNHTEKPQDYLMCKSINVYDDRWRVNVYSKRDVNGIEGKYISKSFFTSFNTSTGELKIIA